MLKKPYKIFCIGLGKTGTTTLAECMKELGYKHLTGPVNPGLALYTLGDYTYLQSLIFKYDSFDDFPWPFLYEYINRYYSNALFILTVRKDVDTWFQSIYKHNLRLGPTSAFRLAYGCYEAYRNEQYLKDLYLKHNNAARYYFKYSSNFLELCWETNNDWRELCEFLNEKVPNKSIPHKNYAKKRSEKYVIERLCRYNRLDSAIFYANAFNTDCASLSKIIKKSAIKNVKRKDRFITHFRKRLISYIKQIKNAFL